MNKAFDKVITPSYLEGCTNTVLLANSTTGSVHTYRDASNKLQFSELFSENCRLLPGYHKGPYQGRYSFCCLWTIYQTLLRLRELPVTPMILRFSRASIPSQTVTPCNPTLTILSVGQNHPGSYLISPSVNTSASPAKNHLYNLPILSTKRLWKLATQRKTLGCGCQAISPETNKYLNSVRKPKILGFVCRLSRYIQSTQTRRTLYLSIVRCHLGYATQVWSPQSIGLLKRVENIQRRTTKLILKLPFRCDVTDETRLQLTNLLPISY